MNPRLAERLVGAFVFVYALTLYLLTVAPTASFWDPGEFIAIANRLQVSHPPGAPFYMLIGRLFSFAFPPHLVALSVNLVSVLSSALTVLLTFLIIVQLIRRFQPPVDQQTPSEHLSALAGGTIGALTFAVTDSFWFNAVESEVYALSMFFTAIVIWLILRWGERFRAERAAGHGFGRLTLSPMTSRYFVLIAYLFGLATGVHLLNLLAIFFLALIVFFEKFDVPDWSPRQRLVGLVATAAVASVSFFVIYPGVIIWLPELALRLGTGLGTVVLVAGLVAAALVVSHRRGWVLGNVVAMSLLVVLIGYSTYALIFIRSAADPPIDENDPEDLTAIVSYLKREQYGDTPPIFNRMHSQLPQHQQIYARYGSEAEYFWQWQVNHMYLRYFLWNFAGRQSDLQDAPWTAGFRGPDPEVWATKTPSERASRNTYFALPLLLGLFGALYHAKRDWRRALSVGVLFFVTGFGIILYLNQTPPQPRERDYSYVASFFAFSLWIGLGAAGLVEATTAWVAKRRAARDAERGPAERHGGLGVGLAVAAVVFAAVPGWMAVENFDDHSRAGRYVAPEYAYNLLNSLEENAIVFTNGDNDTFPLWYLQEVEGVRQDVRVACLSLMNTPWYLKQLKNQWSRDSAPVPMTFSDAQIDQLAVAPWQAQEVTLPVEAEAVRTDPRTDATSEEVWIRPEDASRVESPMQWRVEGRPYSPEMQMLYVADQAVLSILMQNAREGWRRPVYFANTTGRESQLNLQPYFQLEGLAYRVVPIRHEDLALGRVVPGLTDERLQRFKFTNLADEGVYFDENIRRMMDNYRLTFGHTAQRLIEAGDRDTAQALLDTVMTRIPFTTIPSDPYTALLLAQGLDAVGDREQVAEVMKVMEPRILGDMEAALASGSRAQVERSSDYIGFMIFSYMDSGDFEAASALYDRLADITGDESYRQSPDSLRRQYEREQQALPPAPPDATQEANGEIETGSP